METDIAMVGTYNGWLVALSVAMAVATAFAFLELVSRVSALQASRSARFLVTGGAISIGTGIWSTHFVGMVAFRLPIPVTYDLGITALSLLLSVVLSALALHEGSLGLRSMPRWVANGTLIGLGFASMHYAGMEAMEMKPPIRYAPLLVAASVAMAILASTAGLASASWLRTQAVPGALWKRAGSALLIGGGIAAMHYTGMAAASFAPGSICVDSLQEFDPEWLAATVAAFALALQATALFVSAVHADDAAHATRQSRRRLVEIQELERRRLSRELHDRVGQNLTALAINLEILKNHGAAADPGEMGLRLDDSIDLVESTADAIDNVMAELRPPLLAEHGLLPALQEYGRQFARRTGIEVAVHGEDSPRRPPHEIESSLFRVAQEALTNVARHAGARHVELHLNQNATHCTLSVIDDGAGMDAARLSDALASGHGVASMKERVQAVGGRFSMTSPPRGGTHIRVRVPC
jgi:NO-binding membrane sensor protein with MHYT domain/two-component sensor histidine kinase